MAKAGMAGMRNKNMFQILSKDLQSVNSAQTVYVTQETATAATASRSQFQQPATTIWRRQRRAANEMKILLYVVALCQATFLLDDPNVGLIFLAAAIAKAKLYLSYTSGGLGAYSDSRGLHGIRKEVTESIGRRDGYPSDPELIYLTDGASKRVMQILQTVIRGSGDGILIPLPQYPLYSAAISLFGGSLLPYYLEESANWGPDIANLRQSVAQARSKGISVRPMVIINTGNPTRQCLSVDNLQEIMRFCHPESLVLLGDEVYQQNVYQDERPFVSSRKVGYGCDKSHLQACLLRGEIATGICERNYRYLIDKLMKIQVLDDVKKGCSTREKWQNKVCPLFLTTV